MVTGSVMDYAPGRDSTPPSSAFGSALRDLIRVIRPMLACGGFLTLGIFCGCQTEPVSHHVASPPPPAPLGRQATTPPPGAGAGSNSPAFSPASASESAIVVTQVPRFPQQEARPPAPSYRQVWLDGYWTWREDGYAWIAGHWEKPPGNSTLWIRPRWVRTGGSFRFYEGHWL